MPTHDVVVSARRTHHPPPVDWAKPGVPFLALGRDATTQGWTMQAFTREWVLKPQGRLPPEMATFQVSLASVTPDEALRVLENHNPKNRRISKISAARLKNAMDSGRFRFNGDTLKFDLNDDLLDGQHRLKGCHESGKVLNTVIVRCLPPETMSIIDVGARRSTAHAFQILGIPHAPICAPAVKALVMVATQRRNTIMSHDEAIEWIGKYPELPEVVGRWKQAAIAGLMPISASVSAVITLIGRSEHADELPGFIDRFYYAKGSTGRDDPCNRLRYYFTRHKLDKTRGSALEQCACIIMAWLEYLAKIDRASNYALPHAGNKPVWQVDPDHFPLIPGFDYAA